MLPAGTHREDFVLPYARKNVIEILQSLKIPSQGRVIRRKEATKVFVEEILLWLMIKNTTYKAAAEFWGVPATTIRQWHQTSVHYASARDRAIARYNAYLSVRLGRELPKPKVKQVGDKWQVSGSGVTRRGLDLKSTYQWWKVASHKFDIKKET